MPDTHTRTQHTPGPWFADHDFAGGITIRNAHDRFAALYKAEDNVERQTANARLIAAAPDLLAALENALQFVEHDIPGGTRLGIEAAKHLIDFRNAARAAIRKARGEE